MQRATRIKIAAGFSAIALGSGYWMFNLHQQQELWGHWPLVLFLSGWLAVYFWTARRSLAGQQELKWFGMSTAGAVLLALGFPPMPSTPLMFLGLVPIFWILREIPAKVEHKPGRLLFRYGYHIFVLWNILTTFWVANTAFVAGIFAIFVNALFMCVPLLLAAWTIKKMPKLGMIVFCAYWLTFEYIHLRWEISWPWLTLGNSFAQYPSWVQWYSFTGVFGGSLWILLGNLTIFEFFWKARNSEKPAYLNGLIRFGLLIFIPIIVSLVMYNRFDPELGNPVEVVVVQPNFEPHYQKFSVPEASQKDVFLRLSRQAVTVNTDYLVFPETSFGPTEDIKLGKEPLTKELKDFVDEYPNLKLVSGFTLYHIFRNGETPSDAVRERILSTGNIMQYEMINAAVQFTSGSPNIEIYKKSKLVPGAEFLPYNNLLFFLEPLIDKLEGSMAGYGSQEKRSSFSSPDQKSAVGPAICYESIYGEYYSGYVRNNANLTFIMTNDGWWDNTAGHKQHLKFASLRAIETRKPIARSANTGVSGFINARGDILQASDYGVEAAVRGTIYTNDIRTFYIDAGDIIGRIALYLTLLLLLNSIAKQIMPPEKKA